MPSTVNPEMIVVARESRGLSQGELAKHIEVSQAKISKYECGLLTVSNNDLINIAKYLEYPEDFFKQTDKVYGFGSGCTYHRKRQRMPISELRKIEAMMNVFRFNLIRLLRGIEISTENRFVRYDVDEYGGPEECARITRRQWGLPMGPVQSVIGAIESAGAIIYKWSFETRLLDSISQITPGVPPIIFANADIPTDRLRFTLMHEVGHIVMHQLPSDEMEKQADRFAAEFLMPSEEIRPYLKRLSLHKLPPLKTQWKVSMAALIKRAHDIQEITDRQYRTLFTQLSMNGWKTKEPVIIQEEAPTVFRDILNIHVNEHKYSITELSKIANAKESHFKNYLEETNYSGEYRIVG